ncbi:MAG TPA: hypothetical protein VGD43_08930 [Micromonospora sp.]
MTEHAATPPSQPPAGAPVPPQYGAPMPAAGAPVPPAPSKGKGILGRIIGAVVVFAVISLGALAWKYISGDPDTAKVGDCLVAGDKEEDLTTTKCDDAKAQYKVVGKIDNKTEAEFNASSVSNPCEAFPTAESAFWKGEKGGTGYILCLEPVKK